MQTETQKSAFEVRPDESLDETIERLTNGIELRERQLRDMQEMVHEHEAKISAAEEAGKRQKEELRRTCQMFESKEKVLQSELKEKELLFARLQTLERENDKLRQLIASLHEKNKSEGVLSSFFGMLKRKISGEDEPPISPPANNNPTLHVHAQPPPAPKAPPAKATEEIAGESPGKGADANSEEEILRRIRQNLTFEGNELESSAQVFK
eukprot:TRINITY_DN10170_c0_g1_i1.p1 TRINITY_DN10170_c0_g1~~TRINITY_DN10170_c0_g1_i1.p1  ORF type:complete len:210 (-),score=79.25 TRINITY_DN10170_c0_g1_i1:44-673(-)